RIDEQKPRFEASRAEKERLASRFFAAAENGDVDALVEMLAADVAVYGDGGGKAPALAQPVFGRDRVGRLFAGWSRQLHGLRITLQPHQVNGQPGALMLDPDGRIVTVLSLDTADGLAQTIRSVANPDKLRHLGIPADVRGLLRQHRR